ICVDGRGSFPVCGLRSWRYWGSPAPVVARFLAGCWLGGRRRRGVRGEAPGGGRGKRQPWRRTPARSGRPAPRRRRPPSLRAVRPAVAGAARARLLRSRDKRGRWSGEVGWRALGRRAGNGPRRWCGGPSAGFRRHGCRRKAPMDGFTASRTRAPHTASTEVAARAKAEGPARRRHQESRPQRRHHTATPQPPANAHESQRRHPPSQQAARKRATSSVGERQEGRDSDPRTEKRSAPIRVNPRQKMTPPPPGLSPATPDDNGGTQRDDSRPFQRGDPAMRRTSFSLLAGLLLRLALAPPRAPTLAQSGEITLHSTAAPSTSPTPEVARQYGITRSANRVLVNVALRQGTPGADRAVPAAVSIAATNANGQRMNLR